jgi:hypothetical protein
MKDHLERIKRRSEQNNITGKDVGFMNMQMIPSEIH